MDVPTIHPGYVDGCSTLDLCSDDSRGDGADTVNSHRHGAMIEILVFATIFTLIVLLTGGPGNTL